MLRGEIQAFVYTTIRLDDVMRVRVEGSHGWIGLVWREDLYIGLNEIVFYSLACDYF